MHPIPHKSARGAKGLFSGGDADGEGIDFSYALPDRFGAEVAIALAAQGAIETDDESGHLTQWRRGIGRLGAVGDDPRLAILRGRKPPHMRDWDIPAPR